MRRAAFFFVRYHEGVCGIFARESTELTENAETESEADLGFWLRDRVRILFALIYMGCAAGAAMPPSTANRGASALAPVVTGVPSGPAAEFYSSEEIARVTTEPLSDRLAAEVDAIRKRHGHSPILRDGRLDRVATDIALATEAIRMPPREAVAFLLSHYGLVEPESNVFLVNGDNGGEAASLADLRAQLARVSSPTWRREGIGIFHKPGKWGAALVLQEKNFDLDPVPRGLASGGGSKIAGRMLPVFRSPVVLFTSPRGDVERIETSGKDDTFAARFDCNRGDGAYQVEISGADARGPRVLANLPVYCGVAPPAIFTDLAKPEVYSIDPAEAEAQLLEQLDLDRKTSGLPTLVRDPRLAKIARRHSREMAKQGEMAHFFRDTGSVIDRMLAAGVSPPPTVIAENVSADRSAADAERGFMASPGHRSNILNRALTHVGVGVAVGREEAGAVSLYFTQVFAGWGQ